MGRLRATSQQALCRPRIGALASAGSVENQHRAARHHPAHEPVAWSPARTGVDRQAHRGAPGAAICVLTATRSASNFVNPIGRRLGPASAPARIGPGLMCSVAEIRLHQRLRLTRVQEVRLGSALVTAASLDGHHPLMLGMQLAKYLLEGPGRRM
jgi:hypothetical protein